MATFVDNRRFRSVDSTFRSDVLLAWFPFLASLVVIPVAIYVPNKIEFGFRHDVLIPFIVTAAAFFILVVTVLFMSGHWRASIARGLFFIGAFIFLSDVMAPMEWGLLDGESEVQEPLRLTLIEIGLAATLLVAWGTLPGNLLRGLGVPMVLIITGSQALLMVQGLPNWSNLRAAHAEETENPPSGMAHDEQQLSNVYHVVFDGYTPFLFLDAVAELNVEAEFEGFTFFPRTVANYPYTDASVPSYMTGQVFKGGSFRDFQLEATRNGLRREMQRAGYKVANYSPDEGRFWSYEFADYVRTGAEIAENSFGGATVAALAQVALVRLAPNPLRQETYTRTEAATRIFAEFMQRHLTSAGAVPEERTIASYGFYKRLSVPMVQAFLEEERMRTGGGHYVYLHVILPHSPFVWDSGCQTDYTDPNVRTSYQEQTHCATLLMVEIIELLKELGRDKDSIIVFQSDHGDHRFDGDPDLLAWDEPPSPDVLAEINGVGYYSALQYFRRIHALFLVKPPGVAGPLHVSRSPVMLVDVPATIYDAAGIEGAPEHDGRSAFSVGEFEARQLNMFAGYRKGREGGSGSLILGRHLSKGELVHVAYVKGEGWRVLPRIFATHEGW